MRLTVAVETPVATAMWAPVRRHRRKETIRSATCLGVGLRGLCGLDERSAQPAAPRSRKRPTHLDTVLAVTPNDLAASARLVSLASTLLAISSRRSGVNRAFLCIFMRFPLEGSGQAPRHDSANFPNLDSQHNLLQGHT